METMISPYDKDVNPEFLSSLRILFPDSPQKASIVAQIDAIETAPFNDKKGRMVKFRVLEGSVYTNFEEIYGTTLFDVYVEWQTSTNKMCSKGGFGHRFTGTKFFWMPNGLDELYYFNDSKWPDNWCVHPSFFDEFVKSITPVVRLACLMYAPISYSDKAEFQS